MHPTVQKVRDVFKLEIESPFALEIGGQVHSMQYLIKGYGAKNGMVIDKDWSKLSLVQDHLLKIGYGFSCFDLEEIHVEGFEDLLKDWGNSHA